jgi:pyruvate,water dikinase
MAPGSARFLFRCFQRILALNTRALELMAEMERAMGGEYVFDRSFLEASARTLGVLTHQVAYHLNGMTDEGEVALYDAYQAVRDVLDDVLAGGLGPQAARLFLPLGETGWELEPLAGLCAAGLSEIGSRFGFARLEGGAVTATGMAALRDPERRREVAQALLPLLASLPAGAPLWVTLSGAGERGHGRILAETMVPPGADPVSALAALADAQEPGMALAACLRPRWPGQLRGTIQTLALDRGLPPAMLLTVHAPERPECSDRLWVNRAAPHVPLRSRLSPKPLDQPLPGTSPLDLGPGGLMRGSAWLDPDQAALLAEMGLACERALGGPFLLSWSMDSRKRMWIDGIGTLDRTWPGPEDGDAPALEDFEILLCGGQIARGGVAIGPVHPVSEEDRPEDIPLGAVGTARTAAPGLSRLLPRLGALLTEVGSPASHLATVAREHGIPALFGLAGATGLAPDELVTVDADQGQVLRGAAESLLSLASASGTALSTEPEYLLLRRLLRHIRPLNLSDPRTAEFAPARCRTFHDIIHYAHEKAVEALLRLGAGDHSGLGAPVRLEEPSPFPLGILDLGGGLAGQGASVGLEGVLSQPLKAFLGGLLLREAQARAPGRLGLRDIMAGLARSGGALRGPAAQAGLNLAIVSRDYANITLRLGYHFSVVDAVVSDRPEHTFLYFRFAGGFADPDRRARRAELIRRVLDRLGFTATRAADLVVARRKLLLPSEALAGLRHLGALSAFTRQLDLALVSDQEADRLAREFLAVAGEGRDREEEP